VDFPGLLLAALLCAEVAAVGLAVRAAQKTSGPDLSEPLDPPTGSPLRSPV